jgi:transposase-like protein
MITLKVISVEKEQELRPEHPEPVCDRPKINKRGFSPNGFQRYKCLNCGITFTGNPTGKPISEPMRRCPRCKAPEAGKKNGIGKTGKQKYLCKECGYAWERDILNF